MRTWEKDPQAVLDWKFDWADWLAVGETITTSTVTPDAGITKDSSSNTTTTATVWLSGGTLGNRYKIVNRIVTNQGRTDERTIEIKVTER